MNIITAERVREIALLSHGDPIHPCKMFPAITYYRFFRALTNELQPELTVELGTAAGRLVECHYIRDVYTQDAVQPFFDFNRKRKANCQCMG